MTAPFPSLAPRRRQAFLRVLPMLAGGGLLVWHVGALWTWAVLVATTLLLVAVLVSAGVARGVMRAMTRFEEVLVRSVSWLLLGLVFAGVFIPGRLLLLVTGDARFGHKSRDTYWQQPKRRSGSGFGRPY